MIFYKIRKKYDNILRHYFSQEQFSRKTSNHRDGIFLNEKNIFFKLLILIHCNKSGKLKT